jgi:hypothetical protein
MYANVTTSLAKRDLSLIDTIEGDGQEAQLRRELAKTSIKKDFDQANEAQQTCRRQASELLQTTNAIHFYGLWYRLGLVPKLDNAVKAQSQLIGFSNSFGSEYQGLTDRRKEIARLLRIKPLVYLYGVDIKAEK